MHARTQAYMYTHMHTHTHTHARTHAHIRMHKHYQLYIHAYMHAHMWCSVETFPLLLFHGVEMLPANSRTASPLGSTFNSARQEFSGWFYSKSGH